MLLERVIYMNKYDKAELIMDEFMVGLVFPFHINHSLRVSEYFYNADYAEFHEHDFQSIVLRVSEEPEAFYLTEEDRKYYSKQELDAIEQIKQRRKI